MLQTERDVIEALRGRSVTVEDLYAACEAAGVGERDGGSDVVHGRTDTRSRRRVRVALIGPESGGGALQALEVDPFAGGGGKSAIAARSP